MASRCKFQPSKGVFLFQEGVSPSLLEKKEVKKGGRHKREREREREKKKKKKESVREPRVHTLK